MKKLLALTLSLLMVFSIIPMTFVSAETTYSSKVLLDFEDQQGIGQHVGDTKSVMKDVSTITDTTFAYWTAIAGNYCAGVNGKGNMASFVLPENWYEYYDSDLDFTFTQPSAITFDITCSSKSKSASLNSVVLTTGAATDALVTANYTYLVADGNVKANAKAKATVTYKIPSGLDLSTFTRVAVSIWGTNDACWVDNITLVYPHAYIATFSGTETAVLAADVADVTQNFLSGESSIVLPDATVTDGEFAGWVTKDDFKTIIPAGTEVMLENSVDYFAVLKEKPAHATPAAPTASAVTGSSVTLDKVDGAVYSMDGVTWQDSNEFTGIDPNTEYKFYQKMSETLTHAESAVSEALTVTTPDVDVNVALNKSTVSCAYRGNFVSSQAVDGKNALDANNRWASSWIDNAWWVVDLGDVYDVDSIKIYWETAYSKEFKIQVATDEAAWTDVSSKNLTNTQKDETYWTTIYDGGTTGAGLQEITIAEDNQARYVCFQGVKRGTSYGNSFHEFEVYGKKVQVEQDGEITDVIATDEAASIRLNEVNGIRFYTTVDTDALAELVGDKEYEIGTLIAPKDLVGDHLTVEDDCAVVPYDMTNALWEGNKIVGSIVNIRETDADGKGTGNLARDFIARAYVLVEGVYYYSATQSVRSLAYVANAYMNDTAEFEALDADKQALVSGWAAKFNG